MEGIRISGCLGLWQLRGVRYPFAGVHLLDLCLSSNSFVRKGEQHPGVLSKDVEISM